MELKRDYAESTLRNLAYIWKRPVHLETVFEDTRTRLTCDGETIREEEIAAEV